jgi:Cu-Zn family superoxide dismutase
LARREDHSPRVDARRASVFPETRKEAEMKIIGHSFLGVLIALSLPGCQAFTDPAEVEEVEEVASAATSIRSATLRSASGTVVSRVFFTPIGGSKVLVTATVNFPGIRAGFHGIHIHANDNPANGDGCIADPAQPANTHFVSADGHWNPTGETHGEHAGDMPSVLVLEDGSAVLSFTNRINPLSEIDGRAIILHDGPDNHGNIPVGTAANQYTANSPDAITLTQNTGNAGNRIGCGIIQ